MRVLLTTTSFQDTPGPHHEKLAQSGHEIVRERGPLSEQRMLQLVGESEGFDALLHGDDALTRRVLESARPRLQVLSKYGIGLDRVDLDAATELGLPVLYTPGVNHTTVAEHSFALLLMLVRHLETEVRTVREGHWHRITGSELADKTLVVLGLGRIGKEVAKRGKAFGMRVVGHTRRFDEEFLAAHGIERAESADAAVREADVLSLNMSVNEETGRFLNAERIAAMKDEALVVNCARGALVDENAVADACRAGKLGGYAADVLQEEPIAPPHPFQELSNVIVTPHIGSRTRESVQRQADMAIENLLRFLRGEEPLARAN